MTVSDSDDWRVQEARMAKAAAHFERLRLIGQWCNEGHLSMLTDPVNIRVRLEGELFEEPREKFPSVELIAKIQLALHAGRSERHRPKTATEIAQRLSSSAGRGIGDHFVAEVLEDAYAYVAAAITAAVKKAPRP